MIGIYNPALFVQHLGQGDHSGPSPAVWSRLLGLHPSPDGYNAGFLAGDDFLNFQGIVPDVGSPTTYPGSDVISETTQKLSVGGIDGYQAYVDTGGTTGSFTRIAGVAGGAARLTTGTSDNHLAILYSGDLGAVSATAGSGLLTIWEARVRLPTQVTTGSSFFGLAAPTICADGGLVVDTGAIIATTGAVIGFRTLDADPDGIDFIFKKNSNGSEVVVKEVAKVVTATDWVKLGFVVDPQAEASKRVTAFVNNVPLSSYVTASMFGGSTFPLDIFMGTALAVKADQNSVARSADCDWWYCYQSRQPA